MFSAKKSKDHLHRDGHVFGQRRKKQSQGNANRKKGSFKGAKAYRGQGR